MTSNDTAWPAAPTRCRHLRSKQYYTNLPFHPSGADTGTQHSCTCFRTLLVFGPDGEIVSGTDCTAERACFEGDGF